MSNRVYDGFVDRLVAGTFGAWSSADWQVSLHDSSAVFDASATNVSSITGQIGDRVVVDVTVSDGVLSQDGAAWVTSVPAAETVRAVVLSVGSVPVVWWDRGGDFSPIGLVTTGDDVVVSGLGVRITRPVA